MPTCCPSGHPWDLGLLPILGWPTHGLTLHEAPQPRNPGEAAAPTQTTDTTMVRSLDPPRTHLSHLLHLLTFWALTGRDWAPQSWSQPSGEDMGWGKLSQTLPVPWFGVGEEVNPARCPLALHSLLSSIFLSLLPASAPGPCFSPPQKQESPCTWPRRLGAPAPLLARGLSTVPLTQVGRSYRPSTEASPSTPQGIQAPGASMHPRNGVRVTVV